MSWMEAEVEQRPTRPPPFRLPTVHLVLTFSFGPAKAVMLYVVDVFQKKDRYRSLTDEDQARRHAEGRQGSDECDFKEENSNHSVSPAARTTFGVQGVRVAKLPRDGSGHKTPYRFTFVGRGWISRGRHVLVVGDVVFFGEVAIQHKEHVHPGQSGRDGFRPSVTEFVRDDDTTDARADAGGHHGGRQPVPFCAEHSHPRQGRDGAHVQGGVKVEERFERGSRGWFSQRAWP